jgi:ubiquinone/menaquinone biosynthesis C-methylase UbiE
MGDKEFSESTIEGRWKPGEITERVPLIRSYTDSFAAMVRQGSRSLELGAGSCLMSMLLGDRLGEMHCADVSEKFIREISARCAAVLGFDHKRLNLHAFDMSGQFPFPDASFDIVMFDSALHHAPVIWSTLRECRRVLKPDGLLVAQREQMLAPLDRWQIDRLLTQEEAAAGVFENTYPRRVYDYYLRACGFQPQFIPVIEHSQRKWKHLAMRAAPFLNGLLWEKWTIIAKPAHQ